MSRKVLFSPVGGTDPISADNARDGSMLHILRKRSPDAVYLYLSAEMLRLQEQDQRFTRVVEKLSEATGRHIDCYLIERPELKNVQEFDVFYFDFLKEIREIIKKEGILSPEDLLVNTSSGSPAMKNALVVLQALGNLQCTLIQVSAPNRAIGTHTHPKDYDLDVYWELDEDNRPDSEDRTKAIKSPNLLSLSKLDMIRGFIDEYDYEAAYETAQTIPPELSSGFMPFLRLGKARSLLDLKDAKKACAEAGIAPEEIFPVDGARGQIFEYALCCDLKRRRGELADFLRALTPLIVELFELVIEKQLGIRIDDYCKVRVFKDGIRHREWDEDKILVNRADDPNAKLLANAFMEKYKGDPHLNNVSSDQLSAVIDSLCQDDVRQPVYILRERVEKTIRNVTAHEIVSVDDELIRKRTVGDGAPDGLDSAGIMKLVRQVASLAGFSKDKGWNSYDHMNELIKKAVDAAGENSGMTTDVLSR
jgi:CRISPR type III-A/MTUBE-associated protein Csm6